MQRRVITHGNGTQDSPLIIEEVNLFKITGVILSIPSRHSAIKPNYDEGTLTLESLGGKVNTLKFSCPTNFDKYEIWINIDNRDFGLKLNKLTPLNEIITEEVVEQLFEQYPESSFIKLIRGSSLMPVPLHSHLNRIPKDFQQVVLADMYENGFKVINTKLIQQNALVSLLAVLVCDSRSNKFEVVYFSCSFIERSLPAEVLFLDNDPIKPHETSSPQYKLLGRIGCAIIILSCGIICAIVTAIFDFDKGIVCAILSMIFIGPMVFKCLRVT